MPKIHQLDTEALLKRDRRIAALRDQGLTFKTIGNRFGLTPTGVREAIRRAQAEVA